MSQFFIDLFKKFPIETYEPVQINDIYLETHLKQSTFYYKKRVTNNESKLDNKTNGQILHVSKLRHKNFTLLVGGVVRRDNKIWCMDPQCLFIQFLLAYNNNLEFFLYSQDSQDEKSGTSRYHEGNVLSLDRTDVPMLLDNQSELLDTRSLLLSVETDYMSVLERQYCHIIDTKVYKMWQWELTNDACDMAGQEWPQNYFETDLIPARYNAVAAGTHEFLTRLNQNAHALFHKRNHFTLKIASMVWCILQGPRLPIQGFLTQNCQDLNQMTNDFLFQ